ncbi:MAG TPA: hypothetical protein VGQ76_15710, partial [Thermoanaerobaculia bacterium]|nr:hypothetical protein [Thermoanaerobaculia bacterium]
TATRALALALIVAAPVTARAQHALVGLPLDDPAYTQLDGLMRQGCAEARVSQFRPYFVGDIRKALKAAESDSACTAAPVSTLLSALRLRFPADTAPRDTSRSRLSFGAAATLQATGLKNGTFHPLWQDVRPTSDGEPAAVGIGRIRLTYDGGPHVLLVTEAFGETDVRNDPHIRESPFRSTSGVVGFQDAYITAEVSKLIVSLGRAREAWLGAGEESIALSANGPAYDRLLISLRFSKFELRAFAATINDVVLDSTRDVLPAGVAEQRWHRFAFGHGITYKPTKKIELTAGETAVVQRQGFTVDMAYLNPLMIYQTTQHDTSQSGAGDANLTAFFAARATVGRATLSGEFLVDDIQIDSKDRANYPNQLGWNFEAAYALPIVLPTTVGVQYRRLDTFTYIGQVDYSKVYQNFDAPLGSELGPDADMIRAYGEFWQTGRLRFVAGVAKWRHGAYRLNDRPTQNRVFHADDPYPDVTDDRPDVQNAWIGDASAEWLDGIIPITAKIELARITNINNVSTPAKTLGRFQLTASYRFRYP